MIEQRELADLGVNVSALTPDGTVVEPVPADGIVKFTGDVAPDEVERLREQYEEAQRGPVDRASAPEITPYDRHRIDRFLHNQARRERQAKRGDGWRQRRRPATASLTHTHTWVNYQLVENQETGEIAPVRIKTGAPQLRVCSTCGRAQIDRTVEAKLRERDAEWAAAKFADTTA